MLSELFVALNMHYSEIRQGAVPIEPNPYEQRYPSNDTHSKSIANRAAMFSDVATRVLSRRRNHLRVNDASQRFSPRYAPRKIGQEGLQYSRERNLQSLKMSPYFVIQYS